MAIETIIRVRRPQVSFVMATHNRRDVVVATLGRLAACGLCRADYEIIVVDNASTDGTPDATAGEVDTLLRLSRNAGSCAKAFGMERAAGRYVVFLDDDSFPHPGAVPRMIDHFESDPRLGAAGFTVHLPDGRLEGGALPGVFVGCGVGFRTEALRAVGGLDPTFFMQAEEYDLSFRLVAAGWTVKVFDDLHVDHLKTVQARKSDRTTFYDIRNNLRVTARFLPSPYYAVYRRDWLERYRWLAEQDHHEDAYRRGVRAGRRHEAIERRAYGDRRLRPEALEEFFCWAFVRRQMTDLVDSSVHRIVLADLGKNVFAFHQAARALGVEVLAIGDDRFTAPGRRYRGIRVLPRDEALRLGPDAVVVSNAGPIHAARTERELAACCSLPVHSWFSASSAAGRSRFHSQSEVPKADEQSWERMFALTC